MLKKALSMLFTSLLFGLCVADDSKEVGDEVKPVEA